MFADIHEHSCANGFCIICQQDHTLDVPTPDLLCLSPPCQPFSKLRYKSGQTAKTSDVASHPLVCVSADLANDLIKLRKPHIWLVEEVVTWNERPKYCTVSPCEKNAAEHRPDYPGIGLLQLDQSEWIAGSRPRLFMAGFDDFSGGAASSDEWQSIAASILDHRRSSPPTPLSVVLPPDFIKDAMDHIQLTDLFGEFLC